MIWASLFVLLMSIVRVHGSAQEHELYNYLKDSYNKLERPVPEVDKPVVVNLGITLQQIIDVDEVAQRVQMNVWLNYDWKDYNLLWEPEKFGNITDVRFPSTTLWKPDILLYNSVDSAFDSTYPTNMLVYYDGTVTWIPPGIFTISCKIDILWFPFDEQLCYFKFGSWTFDGTKIDLQPGVKGFDMSEYLVNGEWHIEKTMVTRSEKFYECCPEPYPDLKFWIQMKRRTLYFGINLIVPCILITLMCILGFVLPPDAGEKITLQITVLLAVCVFLNMVTNMSPPTSEAVPLLGTFFSTCMVVVGAAVIATVMVLNFHHTSPDFNEMGYATRCILLNWLPWLLNMSRPGLNIKRTQLPNPFRNPANKEPSAGGGDQEGGYEDTTSLMRTEGAGTDTDTQDVDSRIDQCFRRLAQQKDTLHLDANTQSQLFMMHRIYKELRGITQRMRDEDEANEKRLDWVYAAMVIDRFCLWLFLVFVCGSTCFIMFSAPYLAVTVPDA